MARFIPKSFTSGTHWMGGWVAPRPWSWCCGEERHLLPHPGIKPQFLSHPACSGVSPLTTHCPYFSPLHGKKVFFLQKHENSKVGFVTGITLVVELWKFVHMVLAPAFPDRLKMLFHLLLLNPLPALTFWNGRNLNVPCRPKRSKTVLSSS